MKSRFKQIIIIGCGKIAGDVLHYVADEQENYGYHTVFIEYEIHPMSRFIAICRETGAAYEQITDKYRITEKLEAISEPTLVISAGNYYLFPKCVVENPCLEIINFHNALLPKYPGRNAQSWAIYSGETVSGATWHYVTVDIDNGMIIAQRETPITEDIKAYELTKNIMEVAFQLFQVFFEKLLLRHLKGYSQSKQSSKRKIYYSWEIPGNCICSIDDQPEDIYRLLRSVDYGKNRVFPPVRIRLTECSEVEVVRYAKIPLKHIVDKQRLLLDVPGKQLFFSLDGGKELAIRFKD